MQKTFLVQGSLVIELASNETYIKQSSLHGVRSRMEILSALRRILQLTLVNNKDTHSLSWLGSKIRAVYIHLVMWILPRSPPAVSTSPLADSSTPTNLVLLSWCAGDVRPRQLSVPYTSIRFSSYYNTLLQTLSYYYNSRVRQATTILHTGGNFAIVTRLHLKPSWSCSYLQRRTFAHSWSTGVNCNGS